MASEVSYLRTGGSTTNTTLKKVGSISLMVLLSIDVGIKNLALCAIEEKTSEVVHWDVSGVPPRHADGLFASLRNHLDEMPWVLEATTVLIEKQPGMNKTMKAVENFLHAYFVIKSPRAETIIYDARHKVPDVVGTGKTKYRERKNASIVRCREFLEKSDVNRHWLDTFTKSKKKDDLSDTVLQALSYINRRIVSAPVKKQKKLVARKPNENQKNTKYSIPNLVWMVKNHTREELEKDARFMKDLRRYYKNLDELNSSIS
jgi:Poxvirus A22 protein